MREYSWLSLSESEIEKEYNTLKNEVVVSTGLQDLLSIRSKSDLLRVIKLLQKISLHLYLAGYPHRTRWGRNAFSPLGLILLLTLTQNFFTV